MGRLAVGAVLLAGCTGWSPYVCQSDVQCADSERKGVCTPLGFCGFPDAACTSGQRYGDFAPPQLAGECVELDEDSAQTSGPDDGPRRRSVGPQRAVSGDESSSGDPQDGPDAFAAQSTGAAEVEVCDGFDNDGDGLVDEVSPHNDACNGCTLAQSGGTAIWACPEGRSWAAADVTCAGWGAGLAIVDGPQLQLVLAELADGQAWWIGATDLVTEGEWGWADGSPLSYTNWAEGQPDAAGDEDCAVIAPWSRAADPIGWNDAPCEYIRNFICTAEHPW